MLRNFWHQGLNQFSAACSALAVLLWTKAAHAEGEIIDKLALPQSGAYGGVLEDNRAERALDAVGDEKVFLNFKAVIEAIFSNENILAANVVIGAVAIVYVAVVGIRFIISEGKEEEIKTAQKHFGYIILGLFVVSAAQFAAFTLFNPDQAVNENILINDENLRAFDAKAMQVKTFFQIVIGGIALLSIVTTGFRLLANAGNEESINKEKQLLGNLFFATVLIALAEVIVRGVFSVSGSNREGASDQAINIGISEIIALVNALLSIVAGAAILMLVLASLYYVMSLGDEERAGRAKRLVFSTVIALIVIFSAYTILRFFL